MFQFVALAVFALFPALIWNLIVRHPLRATLFSVLTTFGLYVFLADYFLSSRYDYTLKFIAALAGCSVMGVLFWIARHLLLKWAQRKALHSHRAVTVAAVKPVTGVQLVHSSTQLKAGAPGRHGFRPEPKPAGIHNLPSAHP